MKKGDVRQEREGSPKMELCCVHYGQGLLGLNLTGSFWETAQTMSQADPSGRAEKSGYLSSNPYPPLAEGCSRCIRTPALWPGEGVLGIWSKNRQHNWSECWGHGTAPVASATGPMPGAPLATMERHRLTSGMKEVPCFRHSKEI